ncbi:MAG: PAS domain S-box protein, partial [Balneolales bacterium]|nr:PAS domain S-box protein [Balneolales bacterium]
MAKRNITNSTQPDSQSPSEMDQSSVSELVKGSLFDNSITALFVTRPEGTILEANDAACNMFGYSTEEFKKIGRIGIIDPETPGLTEMFLEREKKGSISGRLIAIRKSGEHFWCEFSSTIFDGPGGFKLASVILIDVSDKVDSESKFRGLLNNVPGVVFRYVREADGSDFLQYVSNGSEEVWGFSPSEITKDLNIVWNNFHKEDLPRVIESIKKSAETNSRWHTEYRYHHPDGSLRWCRGAGEPMSYENGRVVWDSIVMDITAEKNAERAVENERIRYEKLLFKMPAFVAILKGPEHQYVMANPEYYTITGKTSDMIIGKTVREVFPELENQGIYAILDNVYKSGEPFEVSEIGLDVRIGNSKEPQKRYYNFSYLPNTTANGTIEGILVFGIDVTHNVLTRKEIEDSNTRYELVTRATSDAIWDYQPQSNQLFWGEGFHSLFGYDVSKLTTGFEKWVDNVHPEDIEEVISDVESLMSGPTNSWDKEYRFRKADGTYAFVKDKAIVVRNSDGIPVRVIGAMEDITSRKEEELQLKLLESVVTNATDAVLITLAEPSESPDGPEIVFANKAFEKLTGYSVDEVIGKTPRILQGRHSESEELQILRSAIRNKQSVEVEILNYSKSGTEYWINISLTPIFENGVCTHFISIQRDVTERKLRDIQKTLSTDISRIFNNGVNVREAIQATLAEIIRFKPFDAVEFWQVDRDKKYIHLMGYEIGNPEIADFYEKTEQTITFEKGVGLPGITWNNKKSIFWEDLDSQTNFIRRKEAADAGLSTAYSFPVMDSQNVIGVLIVLVSGNIDKERLYINLFEELSNQLASEINRKELEEELSRIFYSAPDGITVAGFDGYFKKVNPAFCQILGYTEQELLTTPFVEFVYTADKENTLGEYEVANDGRGNSYFENRYVHKSGKIIWLSWTYKVFHDEEVTYSVAKDITEQKELRELLDKANRLARIGSWEINLNKKEVYWSDITYEIHEESPDFRPNLESSINYFKEGESKDRIEKAVEETMKNGTPWDLELPIITGKGNEKWIRTIGEV